MSIGWPDTGAEYVLRCIASGTDRAFTTVERFRPVIKLLTPAREGAGMRAHEPILPSVTANAALSRQRKASLIVTCVSKPHAAQ
jgi:hypothetical protein